MPLTITATRKSVWVSDGGWLTRSSEGNSEHAQSLSPAVRQRPYLGQGERRLLAGAASHPQLPGPHASTGAFAVDVEAVVGRSAYRDTKAQGAADQWGPNPGNLRTHPSEHLETLMG